MFRVVESWPQVGAGGGVKDSWLAPDMEFA
jgi:hypothetical protein